MWTGTTKAQEGLGLQIIKQGSPVAEVGGPMAYSIVVLVNDPFGFCIPGFFQECSIEVEDQLPAGFIPDIPNIVATKLSGVLLPPLPVPCSISPPNTLTCEIGNTLGILFGGEFLSTQFVEILIPGTAPDTPGIISNTASVAVQSGTSNLGSDISDPFETNVIGPGPQADLFIFKTDAPDPVIGAAGNTITYTLAVGNAGPDDATGIVIQDALPPGTSFVSSDPGGPACNFAPGPNAVICNFPALPAGNIEMVTITVDAPVLAIGDPDLSILNLARIFSNEADPSPGNNIVGEATTVLAPGLNESFSDLVVTKTAPETVIFGQEFFYVVNIFNKGPDTADNVRFRDAPFMGTDINLGGIQSTEGVEDCAFFPAAPNFRCDLINPLAPGQSVSFIIPATYMGPTPLNPQPIFNVANAILGPSNTPDTIQVDLVPSDNTFVNVTNVVPVPPFVTESDLVVTKTSPDTVIAGDVFVYSSQIFNKGPDTADNVIFRDALPADVAFLGAATTGGGVCAATPVGFSCIGLDPIPPGQSITVNARARYDGPVLFEPFPIFNVADAQLGDSNTPDTVQVDPIPVDNTSVRVTNVILPPPTVTISDLVITKAGPDIVVPGEGFGYVIEVTNLGPDTAQNVIVRDIIPEFVTFNSFPGDCSDAITPGELVCNIGDLANGEVRRIGIRAVYNGPVPALPLFRPIFNLAHVDFGPTEIPDIQIDPETADNTVVALTRAIEPPPNINLIDLFLVKTDSPDPVVVEEELTYNLNVYNFGPNDAVGVVVTDTLPTTVTNIDAPIFCAINSNVVTCQLPNPIPANGGLAIIPITVTAPEDPGMILNAAQTFADPFALLESDNTIQIDFAPSNNTDSEKTTVVPVPPPLSDLLITKSDTPDPVIEDDFLTYTIFVKNLGPDPAYGVLISDWLSQIGLDLDTVSFQTTPNVADCVQNPDFPIFDEPYRVECLVPFLGVEESATITVRVKTLPLPDDLEFLNIFNLAKVESLGDEINPASADPNPLNNVVVESTLIGPFVPIADVFVIKSDSPDPVVIGQTLTYVLFASNAGPDPATNVVITDTLPDGVDLISATPNQGTCGGLVGNLITCNLGDLDVGAFTEVRILVRPTTTGTILNVAQISADEHDPKSSNNTSPQTTTVLPPDVEPPDPGDPEVNDLFVLKFASPNPVTVGEEILFTIIVGNNGEFGSQATLIDDLPSGVTFISATSSTGELCGLIDGDVVCEIADVPALGQGQTVVIEVVVRADQTGSIPNIAFLDNVVNDPNTINNVSIVAVDVVPVGNDNPQPTPQPDPDPTPDNPTDDGDSGNGSSGCTVAAGPINASDSAFNFALLLMPLLVFGIRTLRRKK